MKKERGLVTTKIALVAAMAGIVFATFTPAPVIQAKPIAPAEAQSERPKSKRVPSGFTCQSAKQSDRRTKALALVLAFKDPRALALTCRG